MSVIIIFVVVSIALSPVLGFLKIKPKLKGSALKRDKHANLDTMPFGGNFAKIFYALKDEGKNSFIISLYLLKWILEDRVEPGEDYFRFLGNSKGLDDNEKQLYNLLLNESDEGGILRLSDIADFDVTLMGNLIAIHGLILEVGREDHIHQDNSLESFRTFLNNIDVSLEYNSGIWDKYILYEFINNPKEPELAKKLLEYYRSYKFDTKLRGNKLGPMEITKLAYEFDAELNKILHNKKES